MVKGVRCSGDPGNNRGVTEIPLTLVVVSGPPAAGKTEAVEKLAAAVELPFFSKDTFKERLYETFGPDDDGELEARIEAAALAILLSVIDTHLAAGISAIAESNFHSPEESEPLRQLRQRHEARILQVHISGDPADIADRFAERSASGDRHPGHGDRPAYADEVRAKIEAGRWDPLDLPGELIEEEMGYDEGALVERIRKALAHS